MQNEKDKLYWYRQIQEAVIYANRGRMEPLDQQAIRRAERLECALRVVRSARTAGLSVREVLNAIRAGAEVARYKRVMDERVPKA
jgi:hypothetical protein